MPTISPRLSLFVPNDNTLFVTEDIAANWESIDEKVVGFLTDIAASRPAASSANEGFVFYATDTNALTFSDGTAWVPTVAFSVGTVSTVAADDPAAVTNVGTDGQVILDFDIPRGFSGAVISETEPAETDVLWINTSQTGVQPNSDQVLEGTTNLYHTDARVDARIAAADTDDLSEGAVNLYYTDARVDAVIAASDTDDLSEGAANLYYTDTRADARIAAASLADLSDVSGTPAVGETLTYDGTGWVPAARSRNAIINGAFDVFQRGTSFTINSGTYGADRWVSVLNSSVWSRAEDAPAGVGTFSLRMRRNTGTIAGAGQRIESFNSAPLAGQEVTLSFWMREEVANGRGAAFRIDRAGSLNNFTSPVEVVGTTTIGTLTTAWQRFSTTFTLTPECSLGILVSIFAGASFEDFRLTGVQLETGPVATPFQFEDVGTTLAKCQRYFQIVAFSGTAFNAGEMGIQSALKQEMRAAPSISTVARPNGTYEGTDNTIIAVGIGASTITSISTNQVTRNNVLNLLTTGLTTGRIYAGSFLASAEL